MSIILLVASISFNLNHCLKSIRIFLLSVVIYTTHHGLHRVTLFIKLLHALLTKDNDSDTVDDYMPWFFQCLDHSFQVSACIYDYAFFFAEQIVFIVVGLKIRNFVVKSNDNNIGKDTDSEDDV